MQGRWDDAHTLQAFKVMVVNVTVSVRVTVRGTVVVSVTVTDEAGISLSTSDHAWNCNWSAKCLQVISEPIPFYS